MTNVTSQTKLADALTEAAKALPQHRRDPNFLLYCYGYLAARHPEAAAEMEQAQADVGLPSFSVQCLALSLGQLGTAEQNHLLSYPEHRRFLHPPAAVPRRVRPERKDVDAEAGKKEPFDPLLTPALWGSQLGGIAGACLGGYWGFSVGGVGGAIAGAFFAGGFGVIAGFVLAGNWPIWLFLGLIYALWGIGKHH